MAELPDGTLMQRAAAGLAATAIRLLDHVYGSRVVVLAGSGDNGGDALFAGARLAARGADVIAVAAGSHPHAGGAAALRGSGGRIIAAVGSRDQSAASDPDQPGPGGRLIGTAAASAIAAADLIIDGL